MFVRREIWGLERNEIWDPHTLAYAQAILKLGDRVFPTDRRSYAYQVAMHGNNDDPTTGPDGVWNMCQHQSWFFLPWHRMYILFFEEIVRAEVVAANGPADWALPYWDWQANRALPPAFRERKLPDGHDNPLFVEDRVIGNDGARMLPAVVEWTAAEASQEFSATFGFGGGIIDRPSHFGARVTGVVERQPHNNVHSTIAGPMATAASPGDPIFWLHHAQVDRLWSRWLQLGGGRSNPDDDRWLDQEFAFFDASNTKVTRTPRDVVSTEALDYRYEDDPAPGAIPLSAIVPEQARAALRTLEVSRTVSPEPKELGASGPVKLGAGPTSASVELDVDQDSDIQRLAALDVAPSTVALVMEDIELDDPAAPMYEVYLNLPGSPDKDGRHDSPHFVGFLEFFGADHEHGEHAEHAGAKRMFDITSIVHRLQQEGSWDPKRAEVSLTPARVVEDAETGEPRTAPLARDPNVTIGSIRFVTE